MASPIADMASAADIETSEFDFVVVGGGTAGLVVASRLTENPDIRVLVLEAGADRREDPRVKIQGLCLSTYFDPDFDWCLSTEPQVCYAASVDILTKTGAFSTDGRCSAWAQ